MPLGSVIVVALLIPKLAIVGLSLAQKVGFNSVAVGIVTLVTVTLIDIDSLQEFTVLVAV